MIVFQKMSFWEQFKRAVAPAYRRRKDAEMLEAILVLCRNPDMPTMVDGELIPHGYAGLGERAANYQCH